MKALVSVVCLVVIVLLSSTVAMAENDVQKFGSEKELNRYIKARYDGQQFVVRKGGLLAGEYVKEFMGSGDVGMVYFHYHSDLPIPDGVHAPGSGYKKKLRAVTQVDDRTWSDHVGGLNIAQLKEGDVLRVWKFYMKKDYIELYLEPMDAAKLQGFDLHKANNSSLLGLSDLKSARGFGLRFIFFFDEATLQSGDAPSVVSEINKYFMPQTEVANASVDISETEVRIDVGMGETEVLKQLGKPTRTLRSGDKTIMTFTDMKVTFQEGKVVSVE